MTLSDLTAFDHATRLRQDALFADLSGNQLARIVGSLQTVKFAAGELIYAQESQASFLYLIESGELHLTTPGGREIVIVGRRCGEEAASDVSSYLCSATASTAITALQIPRDALAELAVTVPALRSQALLALMAKVGGEQFHKPIAVKKKPAKPLSLSEKVGWLSVIVMPPAIYFLGEMAGLAVEAALFLAILSVTVLMWLFSLADEFVPPLVAIAAVLIVGLVPYEVALAGFSSRTLTTLLGVYALAAVMSTSGLCYRFMLWLLIRLPDTPFWHQTALLLSGYILSPIMPSGNGRLSLVLPFYRDMIDGLGLPAQSKAATALLAATFSGAMLFSSMLLTSKSSNLTVLGMLPTQLQDEFQGLFWFVAASVAAVTVTLAHVLVSGLCFGRDTNVVRAALPKPRLKRQLALLGPVSNPEKAAVTGFLFFLIGAGTADIHQISPAWIAAFLLIGLLLMGLVSKKDFQQKIDWPIIFFLLSLDGLNRAISYLGLDTALARSVGGLFDFVNGQLMLFIPVALVVTLLLRLALPINAGMVVAAVVLIPIAQAQFIHPWVVIFLTAMFSDIWFLPYQSLVYLQVMGSGLGRYHNHGGFLRYNQWMNLSRLAAAYLSIPYWQWLGLV